MAKDNNNLIICNNFYEPICSLSDENAGKLFKAIFHYHLTGETLDQNDIVNFAFLTFKDLIDKNHIKYEEKCKKNKENIKNYWNNKRTNTNEYERIQMNTNIKENKIKENNINEKNIKNIILGEFKNIFLAEDEYTKLKFIYGSEIDNAIELLSNYIQSSGKKYKSHYAVLNQHNWVYKEIMKNKTIQAVPKYNPYL